MYITVSKSGIDAEISPGLCEQKACESNWIHLYWFRFTLFNLVNRETAELTMRICERHDFHSVVRCSEMKHNGSMAAQDLLSLVQQVPGRERQGRPIQQPSLVRLDRAGESGGDVRPSPPGFAVKTSFSSLTIPVRSAIATSLSLET